MEAYLAVDLFFVLSGFVLAEAYEPRLQAGLGAKGFSLIRLARFYPLYILATAFAVLFRLWHLWKVYLGLALSLLKFPLVASPLYPFFADLAFALLLMPAPLAASLFPFDEPAWSLAWELGINVAWARLRPWLSTRNLAILIALAGANLIFCGLHGAPGVEPGRLVPGLGGGSAWGWLHIWNGFSRVAFSFSLGLLLHRLPRGGVPMVPPILLAGVLALALCFPVPQAAAWRAGYDLAFVLMLSPLLVLLGSAAEPQGPNLRWFFAELGALSYPIYILHVPLGAALEHACHSFSGFGLEGLAPWGGLALLGALIGASAVLGRFYDRPVRRWLRRAWGVG
jgi:peptidoglycan/LPS O-acetylase OafA/YrhL